MELDDAAAFRHPDWIFEEQPSDTNFVVLDQKGTIATIANGAGLAMATVDAVVSNGMKPANFLDIGGGANTESVLNAFQKIVKFEDIHAIVINIFAGITRCDEVAKAIIAAKKQIENLPPLFIRLAGTNFKEAVTLLTVENISTLATLEECLLAAKEADRA
jgi:succinyl-CoA synthetase beta subunit